jgi:hypothetical protein
MSVASLLSLSTAFENALGNLVYRLLLHRLQDGPKIAWQIVDSTLQQIFETSLDILPGQNIAAAVDILRTENWGEAGNGLRVRVATHL